VAGSLAIMTDAAHLASDCISFIIGLVAISVGGRPPDERMSFGYKRFGKLLETLVTILMSVPQSPGHLIVSTSNAIFLNLYFAFWPSRGHRSSGLYFGDLVPNHLSRGGGRSKDILPGI